MRLISPGATDAVRYSIVIPAYDEELLLGACLDSLLVQDADVTAEIIVVDNASVDATAAVARGRGVIVLSEPIRGVCAARQTGTDAARGQYVVSVDADTTYEPGFLSRIDESFRARPELVAVAGRPHWVSAPWWGRMYEWLVFGLIAVAYRLTGWVPYASAATFAFARSAFAGYDLALTQGGDELDLLRRLKEHGPVAYDDRNRVQTSSRRMRRGLAYNLFVTCLVYYLGAYVLNRVMRRTVIGMAPAFRTERPVPWPTRQWRVLAPLALTVGATSWVLLLRFV